MLVSCFALLLVDFKPKHFKCTFSLVLRVFDKYWCICTKWFIILSPETCSFAMEGLSDVLTHKVQRETLPVILESQNQSKWKYWPKSMKYVTHYEATSAIHICCRRVYSFPVCCSVSLHPLFLSWGIPRLLSPFPPQVANNPEFGHYTSDFPLRTYK